MPVNDIEPVLFVANHPGAGDVVHRVIPPAGIDGRDAGDLVAFQIRARRIQPAIVRDEGAPQPAPESGGFGDVAFRGRQQHAVVQAFQHHLADSPLTYFNAMKIKRAAELLRHTLIPAKEIAFSLGFEEPAYFTNQFRKTMGMSPREYRKKI